MNKNEFKKLSSDDLVQPNYPGYSNQGFKILTINNREGLIEVNQASSFSKTSWYRYENLSIVTFSKQLQKPEKIIKLCYERYMKSYDVVDDYEGMGPGTLFNGDGGYVDNYDEFIMRLKDDMKYNFNCEGIDVDKIEFVNTREFLETFIKGYDVTFY